jgi:hypothetical protein
MSLDRVAEEIPDVLVSGDAAARQRGVEAVDDTTTIAVNQATDERFRLAVRDLELPLGQDDQTEMLRAWSVLGECLPDTGTGGARHI